MIFFPSSSQYGDLNSLCSCVHDYADRHIDQNCLFFTLSLTATFLSWSICLCFIAGIITVITTEAWTRPGDTVTSSAPGSELHCAVMNSIMQHKLASHKNVLVDKNVWLHLIFVGFEHTKKLWSCTYVVNLELIDWLIDWLIDRLID